MFFKKRYMLIERKMELPGEKKEKACRLVHPLIFFLYTDPKKAAAAS